MLTTLCMNSCWYCITRSPLKSVTVLSKSKVDSVLSRLFSLPYTEYEFVLLGGEPTLSPLLPYILDRLHSEKRVKKVLLLSARISEFLFYPFVTPRVTIHPSSKAIPDFELLISQRGDVQLRLVLDATCKRKTIQLYKSITSVYSDLQLVTLKTPPLFQDYQEFPEIPHIKTQKSYTGKYCLQGTTSILISEKLRYFGANAGCGVVGFKPTVVKCTNGICGCSGNHHVVKTDSLIEARDLLSKFENLLKASI